LLLALEVLETQNERFSAVIINNFIFMEVVVVEVVV
jgi:hypothetical protein